MEQDDYEIVKVTSKQVEIKNKAIEKQRKVEVEIIEVEEIGKIAKEVVN